MTPVNKTCDCLVSIVIPNYNNARYLGLTIESALTALDNIDGEILLIDDCSTDGSIGVAEKYKDSISIYQNEENRGQEDTTNIGLNKARGYYSVILHSDDIVSSNFFHTLLPLLQQHPDAVMAVGERQEIDEDGNKLYELAPFYDSDYWIPGHEQAKVFLKTGFLPCQVLFKTAEILSFGATEKHYEVNLDGLLWFKASLEGNIVYTQTEVCRYRKHTTSTSSGLNKSIVHLFEYYSTLKRMLNYAEDKKIDFDDEFDAAFNRLAALALRYGKEILAADNHALSEQYKNLAKAINPQITESKAFQEFERYLSSNKKPAQEFAARSVSYPPPPGSIEITKPSLNITT